MKSFNDGIEIIKPFDLVEKVLGNFDLNENKEYEIFSESQKKKLFSVDDVVDTSVFSDPVWILYNGDWNDTGIWDDEAIWIDGE